MISMARFFASASIIVRTMRFAGANDTAGDTLIVNRSPAPLGAVATARTPQRIANTLMTSPWQHVVALTPAVSVAGRLAASPQLYSKVQGMDQFGEVENVEKC